MAIRAWKKANQDKELVWNCGQQGHSLGSGMAGQNLTSLPVSICFPGSMQTCIGDVAGTDMSRFRGPANVLLPKEASRG